MLLTKYIENFDSNNPLNEYPRPQLVRDSYMNLNGSWYFTISKEKEIPEDIKLLTEIRDLLKKQNTNSKKTK